MQAERTSGVQLFEATAWYDDGNESIAKGGDLAYFEELAEARSWLRNKVAESERDDPATDEGHWYGLIARGSFVRDGSTGFDEIDLTWEIDNDFDQEFIHAGGESP